MMIFFFAVIVAIFLYYTRGTDNIARIVEKSRSFTDYKVYFIERPYIYKAMDMTLKIRASNWGDEFWRKTFPAMIASSELETKELLSVESDINKVEDDKHKKISLADNTELYDLLKKSVTLSSQTNYNIASGEIFRFWDRALERQKVADILVSNIDKLTKDFKEQKVPEKDMADTKKRLEGYETSLKELKVLPDMKNLSAFIQFAKPENIKFDDSAKTVEISNVNVSLYLDFFKESIFLEKLRKKMPEGMKYIIYLGTKCGMWRLPKEYVRWTVSLDNPYDVLNTQRGAIKLIEEEGFFVITKKKEKYFKTDNKIYDMPPDWRTALPSENNIAAIVIDKDAVKARALSYSLFVSDNNDIKKMEKNFPNQPFLVLDKSDKIYVPETKKEYFVSLDELKKIAEKKSQPAQNQTAEKTQ